MAFDHKDDKRHILSIGKQLDTLDINNRRQLGGRGGSRTYIYWLLGHLNLQMPNYTPCF